MTAHRTTLLTDDATLQLVCSCGWADAPWSTAGLDAAHLDMIEHWLDEAEHRHRAEVGYDVPG